MSINRKESLNRYSRPEVCSERVFGWALSIHYTTSTGNDVNSNSIERYADKEHDAHWGY